MPDRGWLAYPHLEAKNVIKPPFIAQAEVFGTVRELDDEIPISINMWNLTPDVLDKQEERFIDFSNKSLDVPKFEFLISSEIGILLKHNAVRIRVLPTTSQ